MKDRVKKLLSNYPKSYTILKKIYFLTDDIRRYIRNIISIPLMLFPIHKDKIVICSYFGKGYGDNGKYIVEEIIRQGLDYDIVWLLKKELIGKTKFPTKIRVIEYGSLRGLYELSTAKIWIDNCRKSFYPLKRKKQHYIQTWHSPLRLKKIEKDAESSLSISYIKMAKRDSNNIDLLISGCDFSWEIYRKSFWYKGEIIKCGTPRCDLFFKVERNIKDKVVERFSISPNVRLILFAPTFRRTSDIEPYVLQFNEILNVTKERFGGKWNLLIRLHPNVSSLDNLIEYNDKIHNATRYEDMQELLSAVDILITDYSSSMFDMAIANKVCFLHGKDIDNYLEKERELYFEFDELPFYFSKTEQELINNINTFNLADYNKNLKTFLVAVGVYEKGTASEELVERINSITGVLNP